MVLVFHRLTRRASVASFVAMLAMLNLASPASAAGGGSGQINGTVSVGGSPLNGIPLDPGVESNTTYLFTSTNITGDFTDGDVEAEGSVNVTASGGAVGETSAMASGSVTINSCSGSVTILADPDGAEHETVDVGKTGTVTCTGSGTFRRVGAKVNVVLSGAICITGPTPDDSRCLNVTIVVDADFAATAAGLQCKDANGVPHCITQATFTGQFAAEGA